MPGSICLMLERLCARRISVILWWAQSPTLVRVKSKFLKCVLFPSHCCVQRFCVLTRKKNHIYIHTFIYILCDAVSLSNSIAHWGHAKMAFVLQTTFSTAFYCLKMTVYQLTFHYYLMRIFRLTTSHPQNMRHAKIWSNDDIVKWDIYASPRLNELTWIN